MNQTCSQCLPCLGSAQQCKSSLPVFLYPWESLKTATDREH